MKKTFIVLILAGLITGGLYSCKKSTGFLDKKTTTENELTTFSDSSRTMDFLIGIYNRADFNIQNGGADNTSDLDKVTDIAEGRYPATGNFDKQITQAAFGLEYYNKINSEWAFFYSKIRNATIFLNDVDKSPLSGPLKARTKAEARFLRAWYYHFLIKYFGGVPLVGDKLYGIEDAPDLNRSSFQECVDYVVKELDDIAGQLPVSYQGLDYGRVTRGAVLALKSRILLTAASPLFNGGSIATNGDLVNLTAYPSYDANRWEQARLAAKAVMDLNQYSLSVDNETRPGNGFYKVFLTRVNDEFIFSRPYAPGKIMEVAHNPKSRGGSWFFDYPTQNFVDMFPMINGKPITDSESGYKADNPYVNRDPRFNYTVIYNESLYFWNSAKGLSPVYTYVGAADGIVPISNNGNTVTGYFHRKMCDEFAAVTGGGNVDRAVPLMRYAEILLNYAEAANEVGMTADALAQLKVLRSRAGIMAGADGNYGLPASPSKDELRAIIQNERALELAFEGLRFWDLRRWKAGAKLDGKYVQGMSITLEKDKKYTYTRVNVRTRYFKENLYLFPIPQTEISLNRDILQNPGW